VSRGNSAAVSNAVRGPRPRAPELEIPRLARGAGPVEGRSRKRGVVEGFRVLTLLYYVSELPASVFQRLVELFKAYRAVAALCFWSKRLKLDEGVELAKQALAAEALEHVKSKRLTEEGKQTLRELRAKLREEGVWLSARREEKDRAEKARNKEAARAHGKPTPSL